MDAKKIKWHEVTWYSKLGALILFLIVVPILTFFIGMRYQEVKSFEMQNTFQSEALSIPIPEKTFDAVYQDFATSSKTYEIKGKYPAIARDDFNKLISVYIKNFDKSITTSVEISATTSYSVKYNTLGVVFEAFITGSEMAHPALERFTYNYDLTNNQKFSMQDKLGLSTDDYLSKLSNSSRRLLPTKVELDQNGDEFLNGTKPKIENFKNVVLTKTGVRIYFDEYQLGSRPIGAPVVDIPFSNLGL